MKSRIEKEKRKEVCSEIEGKKWIVRFFAF